MFYQTVTIAYETFPDSDKYKWHGMSVIAFDGSKYTLPASDELRQDFDLRSGLQNPGKGHYPQCLVSTAFDVLKNVLIDKRIAPCDTSERAEALKMLPQIRENNVLLFDRGYPGYDFINELIKKYNGYFLFRCSATSSFAALKEFVDSNKTNTIIYITPSNQPQKKADLSENNSQAAIKLRAIKLVSPDGELSILLTNLFDEKTYSETSIQELYYKRWGIEVHYLHDKQTVEIEKFHSLFTNGILQEIYASAIMNVISRILMIMSVQEKASGNETTFDSNEPQFKNALKAISNDIALLACQNPQKVAIYFKELLREIARVRYYKPN